MTETSKLNLLKPDIGDQYDIEQFNTNADILDEYATQNDLIIEQNKENIEQALQEHENDTSSVHGSTASATNNSVMQRNESGQADIADPTDTNEEGIVNVGYAKEKAIEGYGQKTDCILKAGLNIDLEWTDTTVTQKAGSQIINAFGAVQTRIDDFVYDFSSVGDGVILLFNNGITSTWKTFWLTTEIESGSQTPTGLQDYLLFYNYSEKFFYAYNSQLDVWKKQELFLPFAQVTISNDVISDVQKLDSVSYAGKTAWILPQSEILLTDGMNSDGTLKSRLQKYSVLTQRDDLRSNGKFYDQGGFLSNVPVSYLKTLNVYKREDGNIYNCCLLGDMISNDTVITSMTLKRPFFTADTQSGIYGDTNTLPASEIALAGQIRGTKDTDTEFEYIKLPSYIYPRAKNPVRIFINGSLSLQPSDIGIVPIPFDGDVLCLGGTLSVSNWEGGVSIFPIGATSPASLYFYINKDKVSGELTLRFTSLDSKVTLGNIDMYVDVDITDWSLL